MTVLALTCGDPGGIGPEVIVKSIPTLLEIGVTPLIIGPKWPFEKLGFTLDPVLYVSVEEGGGASVIGQDHADNGRAAAAAIREAVRLVQSGHAHAMVTAPISKYSLQLAGLSYTGHTSFLQDLSGVHHVTMGFYTPRLKTVLATVHVPFSKVPSLLTYDRLSITLDHAILMCQQLGITRPKIAMAGLNPHAGEEGMFGDEELNVLIPFVSKKREEGIDISGPYPADTLYFRAYQGQFDMVISLYHDQGLIPMKLIGFHDAVNVTVGLPFVRTSPDHGTAYDIAYQDKANPSSFIAAAKLAVMLAHRS